MRLKVRARFAVAALAVMLLVSPPVAALLGPPEPSGTLADGTLSLRLSAVCTVLMSRETATVRAELISAGQGVPGARLAASSLLGGTFSATEDLGAGGYAVRWTAPNVTGPIYAPIRVRASADGYADVQGHIVFLVNPNLTGVLASPITTFLRAIPSSSYVRPGGTVDFSLYAFTIQGYRIADLVMVAQVVNATHGTVSPVVQQGCGYAFTFTASPALTTDTAILIRVSATKFGYRTGILSIGLTVRP